MIDAYSTGLKLDKSREDIWRPAPRQYDDFPLGKAALSEEPRPGPERGLSSKGQALLVATACSGPPPGRAFGHWICWPISSSS
ncbi:hypothetical protein X747_15320 [Mesorhizobium sp. LNJC384A00]|nr:hypothetical protein X747_15320 [Mesorhizobium sp. LNJC384A00]